MYTFETAFAKITHIIDDTTVLDSENMTGYFDKLVRTDLGLNIGARAKFTDRVGRRGIVLVTSVGNVVIFERYSGGPGEVFVTNRPSILCPLLVPPGELDEDRMFHIIGLGEKNGIQSLLEELSKELS